MVGDDAVQNLKFHHEGYNVEVSAWEMRQTEELPAGGWEPRVTVWQPGGSIELIRLDIGPEHILPTRDEALRRGVEIAHRWIEKHTFKGE